MKYSNNRSGLMIDFLENFIDKLIEKSIDKILLFFSVLLLLISFITLSFDGEKLFFQLERTPNMYLFIIAMLLLCLSLMMHLVPNLLANTKERRQYDYIIDIDGDHKINIKQGDISKYDGDLNKALLLPANTSFDEKCITDTKSALGSYFLKFPENIDTAKKLIIETATEEFSLSEHKKCSDIGATILLPKYDGKHNILISAVTQDLPNVGIQANALGIINTVKNALSLCSEKRYSSITMPIIGTGHGGIKHNISLTLICLQYFISLRSGNHHVKELVILVFDPNRQLERDISETVECIKKLVSLKTGG